MRKTVEKLKKHWFFNAGLAMLSCVMRNTIQKLKKHCFFSAGLAVLVCVICIWIVKFVAVDIGNSKAAVFDQTQISATRRQMTQRRILEEKYNTQNSSTGSLVFRHTPSTMPVSVLKKERKFLNTILKFPNTILEITEMLTEQENLRLVINRQGCHEGVENNGE